MANCISFELLIKENAKCVELLLLYIQLQSTRGTGSSMARPQAHEYCETHASAAIQFTIYLGRHWVIS